MDHPTMDQFKGSNPCTDHLTDIEDLGHMIPHHQVAVDMSDMLEPKTTDPVMLNLCREIKRKQKYEIWEMNMIKNRISDTVFHNSESEKDNITTILEIYNPKLSSSGGECNPLFFKPDDHSKHMEGMEITGKSYLEHMIPHHQVAIDMSKRLLMHTNHSYLIDFCRKLIVDQQGEIFYMNNLLQPQNYKYKSNLLNY